MKEERISYEIAILNKRYLDLYHTYGIYEGRKNPKSILKTVKKYIFGGRIKEFGHLVESYLLRREKKKEAESEGVDSSEFEPGLRVAVYTCLTGDYDTIKEPVYVNRDCCDFFIVTNEEVPGGSIWKKIDIDDFEEIKNLGPREKARYVKTHPHIMFPDYDYSIWIDASFTVMADVMPIIGAMGNAWFGVHNISNGTDCVYENAVVEIGGKKESKENILRQVQAYKAAGYPEHNGLFETGILVRKHNEENCIRVMEDWWEQMSTYCMRDQMSVNYVFWKNQIPKSDVWILGNNIYMNPRFSWQPHRNYMEGLEHRAEKGGKNDKKQR